MWSIKFYVFITVVYLSVPFTGAFDLALVESCTAKVKDHFLKSEEAQNNYRSLLDDGGDAVGFQLQIDKYDAADAKDKNKLRTLMHNLVPLLLQNQNVSDAVLNYFNTITPDDLVKIIDIAEDHNTAALETYVLETFNHLGLNEAQRQDINQFIDSIHNVKNANKNNKSK
uniref:Uncharacterized protein n=1 Tax=Panagrolaimus sp. ES5 TaxID=591445 RepID=A0AC34FQL2_9BILA